MDRRKLMQGVLCTAFIAVLISMTNSEVNSKAEPGAQGIPPQPVAERRPWSTTIHGETRTDPWRWLRERGSAEVLEYLRAENRYADAILAPSKPLAAALYAEMVGRIQETDATVPERDGAYEYFTRTVKGKQYTLHCRREVGAESEQVFLDENELARGHSYFDAGAVAVSPNGRLLAYAIDTRGNESYNLFVRDLESGEVIDGPIHGTYAGVEWCNDNETLYYNVLDDEMRPYRLYRHRLGDPAEHDELICEEQDAAFFLGVRKTRDKTLLVVNVESNTTTEEQILDANDPAATMRMVAPRVAGVEYYVDHRAGWLYVITNQDAREFRLARARIDSPGRDQWEDVIAPRSGVKLDDFDVFRDFLVVYERERGLRHIRVIRPETGDDRRLKFDEPVYTVWSGENPDFESSVLRVHYSSPVTPETVLDYDMRTHGRTVRKTETVHGYDASKYRCERVEATARDGTKVPVSLVYRRDTPRDGSAPLFVYGYGAYGASIEPYFVSSRVSLLDRGVVFAIAHVRGGGELGRAWYEAGKLMHKRNTFTDFVACTEYLVDRAYADRSRVACAGGSAGGLLVGASLNLRPDLWRVAIADVPFVDVINTMLDPDIPLTVTEYEEWGNPNEKAAFEYMASYSPYDNVAPNAYPAMYVSAGLNDPRVQYWEPAKWVARIRNTRTNELPVVLRTKMSEGHGGASGRYDYLRDLAEQYAFVLHELGATERVGALPPPSPGD